jgi:hypothetical protein
MGCVVLDFSFFAWGYGGVWEQGGGCLYWWGQKERFIKK